MGKEPSFTPSDLYPLGDTAVLADWGGGIDPDTHGQVRSFCEHLASHPFPGMLDIVPAFNSVAVYFDPVQVLSGIDRKQEAALSAMEMVQRYLRSLMADLQCVDQGKQRVLEIPVCYGGEYGPDLDEVARHTGLTPDEVIAIHAEPLYLVYMLGFAPGFPYLGGMSERIAVPRRDTPRQAIPAGSVGIGGRQTGIYSLSTPGGWQVIGRTPLALFRPAEKPPTLLRPGDRLRFRPISPEEYQLLKEGEA